MTLFKKIKKLKISIHKRFYKGHLESKSDKFYKLISKKTKIHKMASGFKFTEGPIWFEDGEFLLFSDIPASKIYKLGKYEKISVFRDLSNNSNGLTIDSEGCLIACEHGRRQVTRTEKDGSITVLADSFKGKKLNSPNDVVTSKKGLIYFTDPPFGIKTEQQELSQNGVYSINQNTLEVKLLTDVFERPNGLALSPDGKYLYVDDSWQKYIKRFSINENGELDEGEVFYEFSENLPGNPDGMKVDIEGNIYCTGPGGISVISPNGELLGKIVLPEIPSNCAWGDEDNQTLFITAQTSVYKLRTKISGYKPN